jgi:acyl-CoA dehydrogenase
VLEIPALPEETGRLKLRVRDFIEEHVRPLEARVAEAGVVDPGEVDALRAIAREAGFHNHNMPVEYGGLDLSILSQVALEEEAGRATNGLGFIAVDRGPRELAEMATPEQFARYVAPVLRGERREAWAVTEPGAGSDVSAIETTAVRDGDDWVLNGEKWFVTGGERAGYFIVLAWADGRQTLFLVDADTPGLELVRTPRFMHDPYITAHVELRLTDCRVGEAQRVVGDGDGGARVWFTIERLMIAARCCGAAERLIELASAWAQERVTFGRPIADHQAIQFMLADSLTELLAARLMTWNAAHEFDLGSDPKVIHGKTSMAKLYASEMAGRVVDRALQILGGRGYMTENPVERYYRELRVDRIWEGTSEIQRIIVARGLRKRGVAPYACS